jgi:hypothetical protein
MKQLSLENNWHRPPVYQPAQASDVMSDGSLPRVAKSSCSRDRSKTTSS